MLAAALGILIGLILPLQTTVNSRLRWSVGGSPFLAAFISFFLGTVTLFVASLVADGGLPDLSRAAGVPPWLWIGGVLGVLFLSGNILLFPHLGAVQTVVLPVTGQVLMGLLIDHFGWFGVPRVGLTVFRVIGAALVLAGLLGAIGLVDRVRGRSSDGAADPHGRGLWWWRLAGISTGACAAAQTAINGRLGVALGSAVAAALVSFTIGTLALLLFVLLARTRWQLRRLDQHRNPWWMWIGGSLGAAYVFGNAFLAPIIGTGLTVMFVVLGMMLGSLLFDHFGLLGAKRKRATVLQGLGLALMVAGLAMIRLL